MNNYELYHHGVKDQKWGRRRYQNEDGSLTPLGREHYGYGIRRAASNLVKTIKTKHETNVKIRAKKKTDKIRKANLEKARKVKEQKAIYEANRKRAIETGSAEEVLKYKNTLSLEEKNDIMKRLEADKKLTDYASSEAKARAEAAERNSKWNKINNFAEKVEKSAASIDKYVKFYNSSAKVINAFIESPLPIIGEKKDKNLTPKTSFIAKATIARSSHMNMKELDEAFERINTLRKIELAGAGLTNINLDSGKKNNDNNNNNNNNKKEDKKKK